VPLLAIDNKSTFLYFVPGYPMTRFASTKVLLAGLCLMATCCCTGCQTAPAGNPLPSPNYLDGQVQYFPTGPKFKLTQEAAAMKAYSEQQAGHSLADQQIHQASGTIPSMNMQPYAQAADNSVTISAE
jgi:hypothetical protein